jgi:DNA polymerase-3 subunit beta
VRFTITDAAVFSDAAAWVAKHINPKVHIPVLATLRIDATTTGVRLSAYDYEVSATVDPVPGVEVVEPGTVAVGGAMFAQMCSTVRPERVEADDAGLRLASKRSSARLPVVPVDQLPELPTPPATTVEVHGPELARSITQLAPLCCDPVVKVEISGIRFATPSMPADQALVLDATDRYRVARHELDCTGTLGAPATVPPGPLLAAVKGWGSTGVARLGSDGQVFVISQGARRSTISVIAGAYVDVGTITGEATPCSMEVDGDALKAALKAGSAAARVMDLDLGDVLTVRAADDEKGQRLADWETQLDCQPDLNGGHDTKRVNASFLASCLDAVDGPQVRVGFHEPGGRRLIQLNQGAARQAALMAIRKD